jgi:non-ribosomal peptide synthase protein (TIGR01720 family)
MSTHNVTNRIAQLSPEKRDLLLKKLLEKRTPSSVPNAEQGLVTGPMPLLPPVYQVLMMMDRYALNLHHFNSAILVQVQQALDPDLALSVVQTFLQHHDALRLRLTQTSEGWQQFIVELGEQAPFTTYDLSMHTEAEQQQAIEHTSAELQTSLNVTDGPIFRIAYFYLGPEQPGRLLLIVHHLASDVYSLRILLEDFVTAYQQVQQGLPIQLPAKTTSVIARAKRMLAYAQTSLVQAELPYWLSRPYADVLPVRVDNEAGRHARPAARQVDAYLTVEETQALLNATYSQGGETAVRDTLLSAFAQVFTRWCGTRTLMFAMNHHGREPLFDDVDVSRTVGWLSVHPGILLQLPESEQFVEIVQSVTTQMQAVPSQGLGYELLRYASRDTAVAQQLMNLPIPSVTFNYIGQRFQSQVSSFFTPASESFGEESCLPNVWKSDIHFFRIDILNDRLHVYWLYSESAYHHETIEMLTGQFLELLRQFAGVSARGEE